MTDNSNQETTPIHIPRIEFQGMNPLRGVQWCAICAALYMNAVAHDPAMVKETQNKLEIAQKNKIDAVYITLPPRNDKILRPAVTTAVTMYFPFPLPTCWIHIQPYENVIAANEGGENSPSSLITGKDHSWKTQQ